MVIHVFFLALNTHELFINYLVCNDVSSCVGGFTITLL